MSARGVDCGNGVPLCVGTAPVIRMSDAPVIALRISRRGSNKKERGI